MGKSTYVVSIVKRDLMPLWHDYWDSKKPSKEAKKLSRDGSLGQTATVMAKNKRDAQRRLQKRKILGMSQSKMLFRGLVDAHRTERRKAPR